MPAEAFWVSKFLGLGDVQFYHVDLTPRGGSADKALSWLDEDEHERWQRYVFDRSRRQFALCRSSVRSILCRQLDCRNDQLTFGFAEHGKPFALVAGAPVPISFNVSHSGRHGLVGITSKGRLGVDVEERIPPNDIDGISEFVFGPYEQSDIARATGNDKSHLFFTIWTLKEALIKALGTGFSLNPSRFEIPSAMRDGTGKSLFQFPHLPDVTWKLEDLGNADFAAAFAHELDQPPSGSEESADA